MSEEFTLTVGEQDSALWRRLRREMERRRAEWREANDHPSHDDRATAMIRGRIAELTELIALGDPPEPESSSVAGE